MRRRRMRCRRGADRPAPTRELGAYRANSEEGVWFGHSVRVTPRDECRPLAKSEVTPQGSGIIFFIFLRSPSRTRGSFVFDARETLSASRAIAPKRTENARRTRAEHARRADRASKGRDGRARRRERARCYNDDTFVTTPARRGTDARRRRRTRRRATARARTRSPDAKGVDARRATPTTATREARRARER